MRKCVLRGLALSCAAAILIGVSPAGSFPAAAAGDVAAQSAVLKGSYVAYIAAHADAQQPKTQIDVPADSYTASQGTELKTQELGGEAKALVWSNQSGWVEWTVMVPQTGLYRLSLGYYPYEGNGGDIELELAIDGSSPFSEAQKFVFTRLFQDENETPAQDNQGNDLRSAQVEIKQWMTEPFSDSEGYQSEPYSFYFEKGTHTIRLGAVKEPLALREISLYNTEEPPSYQDYLAARPNSEYRGECRVYEAEKTADKTSAMLYPISDRADSATTPSDPVKKRLNTIGGSNWIYPTQEINWTIEAPGDGYYTIGIRVQQHYLRGLDTYRKIQVDGSVPFRELEAVPFAYGVGWQFQVLGGSDGAYRIYLTKGRHTLTMTPTLGALAPVLSDINYAVYTLNDLYRRIVMITSVNPDIYRDYYLQESVPGLIAGFKSCSALLKSEKETMIRLTGHKGSEANLLQQISMQLDSFVKEPDTIPERLESFRTNISSLADWILTVKQQALLLDKFYVAPAGTSFPNSRSTILQNLSYQTQAFMGSFFVDYNSVGSIAGSGKTVKVWVSSGRDQAEVLKTLCDADFTKRSGISVNLSIVQNGLMQAIMAGKGPDVALMVGRGDPVNFALRKAVLPLDAFEGLDGLQADWMPSAVLPYQLQGHTYGLPETQNFFMMFYRTDIFSELGLQPPTTWDELYSVIETLNQSNMNVGMPYVSLDAYSVVSQGLGTQSIFPTLLLQKGISLYNASRTATTLNSSDAVATFRQWTNFYTQYGLPVYKDDYNRFRTGEMPLVISNYTFYNMLYTAAPEIRNLWSMTCIPGTVDASGSIDRAEAASGTACVMVAGAKDREASWQFMKWWVSGTTQGKYGIEIENVLGAAGRYNPASITAMKMIPWTSKELKTLLSQWQQVQEIPEIPGGYYTSRNIDNAFKAVIYNNENLREALSYWNKQTDDEIVRKRQEFGIKDEGGR